MFLHPGKIWFSAKNTPKGGACSGGWKKGKRGRKGKAITQHEGIFLALSCCFSACPIESRKVRNQPESKEKERKLEIKRVGERERKLDIVQDSLTLRDIEGEVRMERMD